ncbi:uncharacterized protein FIESC28_02485 [Fusarium coffeatum]|uniref:Uncharacterized protein n=1 Tax=Fusarium coffeatum TaxID=231269 RepID=A0A366S6T1_9HYPO|nr:uncharacterized protein FIESC28_02485 [Fusarium coffeatum]RBR24712.1 hypothetical protein FIESC28_02485 [Fusarium coffeatum]
MNQQVEIKDPEYNGQVLPGLYGQHTTFTPFHHGQTASVDESSDELKEQRGLGVMVNHTWSAEGDSAYLAQYCGFRDTQELTAYVDMIVPDIVHEAAFIASDPVGEHQRGATGDVSTFQKFIQRNDFYNPGGPRYRGRVGQYDFTDAFDKPSPLELLKAYHENQAIRSFVDQVVSYCPKPTFIPARNWHFRHVRRDIFQNEKREVHPEAFVLVHAVQLLLFASQDWRPDRVYSRDMTQYEHRFPTPEFIGGGTDQVVAGLFFMEDLHRAILLFYYLVDRRQQHNWVGNVPGPNGIQFAGYHSPDAEASSTATTDAEPVDDGGRVETTTFVSQLGQYCAVQ